MKFNTRQSKRLFDLFVQENESILNDLPPSVPLDMTALHSWIWSVQEAHKGAPSDVTPESMITLECFKKLAPAAPNMIRYCSMDEFLTKFLAMCNSLHRRLKAEAYDRVVFVTQRHMDNSSLFMLMKAWPIVKDVATHVCGDSEILYRFLNDKDEYEDNVQASSDYVRKMAVIVLDDMSYSGRQFAQFMCAWNPFCERRSSLVLHIYPAFPFFSKGLHDYIKTQVTVWNTVSHSTILQRVENPVLWLDSQLDFRINDVDTQWSPNGVFERNGIPIEEHIKKKQKSDFDIAQKHHRIFKNNSTTVCFVMLQEQEYVKPVNLLPEWNALTINCRRLLKEVFEFKSGAPAFFFQHKLASNLSTQLGMVMSVPRVEWKTDPATGIQKLTVGMGPSMLPDCVEVHKKELEHIKEGYTFYPKFPNDIYESKCPTPFYRSLSYHWQGKALITRYHLLSCVLGTTLEERG